MQHSKLGFDTPIQNPTKRSHLEMTPDAIRTWRALLPMADTGATAKKVYLALSEVNQTIIDPIIRFEILELFRPPIQMICQSLRKHYINQTTPLTKQKLTIANLAQTLQVEMTNGYKTVIVDLHLKKNADVKKHLTPTAIHRAMHYNTLVLLRCYQLYSPAPKGLWQEIHALYKYAKDEKILKHNVGSEVLISYKHILLLAATNPFQWQQNEQEIINNTLDLWAPYASIRSYAKSDIKKPGIYILDLTKDLPPNPLSLEKIDPSESCLVLDLQNECMHIEEILSKIEKNEIQSRMEHDGDPEYGIAASTLRRLLNSWKTKITRKHKRFNVAGQIYTTFGLAATHYYVNGEKPFNPQNMDNHSTSINTTNKLNTMTELPTFDAIENDGYSLESVALNGKVNKQASLKKEFPVYACTLVNMSPAGSCLMWESDSYPPIQAGEIIGLHSSEGTGKHPWNIGVVRWLKHTYEGKMKIGIQLLAPYAKAAGAQLLKGNTPAGYFLRCLILPKVEHLELKSTIITLTLPFKQGETINLCYDGKSNLTKAKLARQVDATNSYRQFIYSTTEQINLQEETATKIAPTAEIHKDKLNFADNKTSNKFDSIWDKL